MNMESKPARPAGRAVEFTGRWQDYLKIAAVNLLLTVVTLGIYRFWATARTRRYLWSRTRLVGSELEWTGTGGEMFVGFLMVVGVLVGWVVALSVMASVSPILMGLGILGFYIFLAWAIGFAQFRALRYRLSRTYWCGIRGGSEDNGLEYAGAVIVRNIVVGLSLGIAAPWAMVENWNDRINAMWFGDRRMESNVTTEGLWIRWAGVYAAYILTLIGVANFAPDLGRPDAAPEPASLGLVYLAALVMVGGAFLAYYALYFRKAAAEFNWTGLSADFDARAKDWIGLYCRIVGLGIVTLGVGFLMARYLRWKFVMDHLSLYGEVHVDEIGQSHTVAPTDAEGFADAFDIGAF